MKRGTPRHPKVKQLAARLKINHCWAVGILELLFHACAQYAPRGNIGKWENEWIADAVHWPKCPDMLVDALVECEWLDRDPEYRLIVHNWSEHADQTVRKTLSRSGVDFIEPSSQHSVYFIRSMKTRSIKIGVTGRAIADRLREIRSGTLENLELIGSVPGGYKLESEIHSEFKHLQVKGEWFKESEDLLLKINDLIGNLTGQFPAQENPSPPTLALPEPKPIPKPGPVVMKSESAPPPASDYRTEFRSALLAKGFRDPDGNIEAEWTFEKMAETCEAAGAIPKIAAVIVADLWKKPHCRGKPLDYLLGALRSELAPKGRNGPTLRRVAGAGV